MLYLSLPFLFFILSFTTWIFYLAVMMLKQRKESLTKVSNFFGHFVLYLGYLFDVTLNLAASFLFLELPHEWLLSARIARLKKETGWRSKTATWICHHLLHPIDPGHCD